MSNFLSALKLLCDAECPGGAAKKENNMNDNFAKGSVEMECLEMISSDLKRIKINPKCKGFSYLTHAIFLSSVNQVRPKTIKSVLFAYVANMFGAKVENVERACRNAIESAYFNEGLKHMNETLGFDCFAPYERPTLTCFISTFAQKYILLIARSKTASKLCINFSRKKGLSLKCNKLFSPAFHFCF